MNGFTYTTDWAETIKQSFAKPDSVTHAAIVNHTMTKEQWMSVVPKHSAAGHRFTNEELESQWQSMVVGGRIHIEALWRMNQGQFRAFVPAIRKVCQLVGEKCFW